MFCKGCQVAKITYSCEQTYSFLNMFFVENRTKIDRNIRKNSVCSRTDQKLIRGLFLGPPLWPTESIFNNFLDPTGSFWAPFVEEKTVKMTKRIVHQVSRDTPRRPRMSRYGFQIAFSLFWMLQGLPGCDLGSLFAAIFNTKSNGSRIDFPHFMDELNALKPNFQAVKHIRKHWCSSLCTPCTRISLSVSRRQRGGKSSSVG